MIIGGWICRFLYQSTNQVKTYLVIVYTPICFHLESSDRNEGENHPTSKAIDVYVSDGPYILESHIAAVVRF